MSVTDNAEPLDITNIVVQRRSRLQTVLFCIICKEETCFTPSDSYENDEEQLAFEEDCYDAMEAAHQECLHRQQALLHDRPLDRLVVDQMGALLHDRPRRVDRSNDPGVSRRSAAIPAPRLVCMDGASVSVQVGRYWYSLPQTDTGPYAAVEAGYPSVEPPESWARYAQSAGSSDRGFGVSGDLSYDWWIDIYPFLPYEKLEEFIAAHGGLREDSVPHLPPRERREWPRSFRVLPRPYTRHPEGDAE